MLTIKKVGVSCMEKDHFGKLHISHEVRLPSFSNVQCSQAQFGVLLLVDGAELALLVD